MLAWEVAVEDLRNVCVEPLVRRDLSKCYALALASRESIAKHGKRQCSGERTGNQHLSVFQTRLYVPVAGAASICTSRGPVGGIRAAASRC